MSLSNVTEKSIDKIAMGAQKWVDINAFDSISNCVDTLKSKGYQIIATTPHDNDCLLEDFDITKPSALFFGTERRFVGRNYNVLMDS
jgi:tRNA (guanosine-2'-O-)-methyltransferase